LVGPLPRTSSGFEYIIVISCEFTRWTEFYPLRAATSKSVIAKLHDYFCRFGFAKKLKSDNASVYKSKLLSEYCERFGMQQMFINSYKPRENCAERRIRDLKVKIKTYAADNHKSWDKFLPEIGFAIRSSICETTNFSPAMLMLHRELQHPLLPRQDAEVKSRTKFVQDIVEQMQNVQNIAIENIAVQRQKAADRFNKGRKEHIFKVGNLVWRKTNILSSADKRIAASLAHKRDGPFKISRILGKNSVMLETLEGQPAGKRHTEDLKLFVGQPEWVT
jgi:transposase